MTSGEHPYDVALSFAGEDREIVGEIVRRLREYEVRVCFEQGPAIWELARFVVLFLSRHYERPLIEDSALYRHAPRVVAVRLDDSPVSVLPPKLSFVDARVAGADGIAREVLDKLGESRATAPSRFTGGVPRTPDEMAALLAERPHAWEFLLYGAVLRQGIDALEDRYRDHLLEYAPSSGEVLGAAAAYELIRDNFARLLNVINALGKVTAPELRHRVFGSVGAAGSPGDPDRIIHLGRRIVGGYEEFLAFAARLRGADIAERDLAIAAQVQARMVSRPLEQLREFVTTYTGQVERFAAGEHVAVRLHVSVDLDESVNEELLHTLQRYQEKDAS